METDTRLLETMADARPAGHALGELTIHGETVAPVTPGLAERLAPAALVLHEWTEYTVRCAGAVRIEAGAQSFTAIETGIFRIRFDNQIGLSRLVAFDAGERALASGHVEVISPKLGGAERSLAFLRALLADLTSEEAALAFLPQAPTSRTVRQVFRPPSPLIQYFFLVNNADAIIEATQLIERSPHRVLDDEREHLSVTALTDIDADVVLQLVQGGAAFEREAGRTRVRAAPHGVWFRVPREGFDSAENRYVRSMAEAMAAACDDVLAAGWLRDASDPAMVRRRNTVARLAGRLEHFWRAPMFDEVGPLHRVPAASRVIQRRAGYRELNRLWQAFLTSREPVWQRMQRAIDLRDIATLYEYWVWFALVREVQAALVAARPAIHAKPAADPALPQGMEARFPGFGTLHYNATRRAYSGIPLRPDYLWEPVVGTPVAFDAKFRLAWDAAPLEVDEVAAARDREARAKVDDLVKMHAYRDAIPGLRAAVVLYPGHVAEFRPVAGERKSGVTVADVLSGELAGVGAIPMRPQEERDDG